MNPPIDDVQIGVGPREQAVSRRAVLIQGALAAGAGLLATGLAIPTRARALVPPSPPSDYDVKAFGATGDGVTDDSTSVNAALTAAQNSADGGRVFFPPGRYMIRSSLRIDGFARLTIAGVGRSSQILWGFDGHLFRWAPGVPCRDSMVRDLMITGAAAISPMSAAFYCGGGCQNSIFKNISTLSGSGVSPLGSIIFMDGVSDTVNVESCELWDVRGIGIRVGPGSSIFVDNTRITGDIAGSVGISLTGNNGGVYISSTDLIGHSEGLQIGNFSGAGSNREVFLTHTTLDSCNRGLGVYDGSYVSIAGCWAASCRHENIQVEFGAPLLVINGGTIFNAGAAGVMDPAFGAHGMIVNSGSFILSGVAIRNNRDKGVWVPNASATEYTITGCKVYGNGMGISLAGHSFICANNVFSGNAQPNAIWGGATNYIYNNNVGG
jgi:hypothetical protein